MAQPGTDERVARSTDGVSIAFNTLGTGAPALVFVHGGLANRGFWWHQLESLSNKHQVVTLDLAGHGGSGSDRRVWSILQFAQDVRAVVATLALSKVVLVGNSLGGPVALEAAALLPGRVIGVIGVDTLHDAAAQEEPAAIRARAQEFARDSSGSCHAMVGQLFHLGAHAELRKWAEREMCAVPPSVVVPMLESFAGYDMAAAFRRAGVPIRAINGDLWPTSVERNRMVAADFDVTVMPHTGHYPMLEQPDEFNRLLLEVVAGITSAPFPRRPPD